MSAEIDPITTEVIRHALNSVVDEMDADIVRTAYSPLIYRFKDYAIGLLTPDRGLITHSQGPLIFVTDLDRPLADCLEVLAEDGLTVNEGDVVLHNFIGVTGQHANNVNAYSPAFVDGELVGWSAVRAHWGDVGGKEPGSSGCNNCTSSFQEGFFLRASRVMIGYEWAPDVVRLIRTNTRLPDEVIGDMKSQVLACLKGARKLADISARYGAGRVLAAVARIQGESEELARRALKEIPNGIYRAVSFLDFDGVRKGEIHIPITVEVQDAHMTIDFTEVSRQAAGPLNSGNGAETAARAALMFLLGSDRRADAGTHRAVSIRSVPGTLLTAQFPAPMARWSLPLPTVVDTILKALSPAIPNRISAGHHASMGSCYFFFRDTEQNLYKHSDVVTGGWGAFADRDGAGPYKTLTHGDSAAVAVEVIERMYPIQIEYYRFRQDSAGLGQHNGGWGTEKKHVMREQAIYTCIFDRYGCPPWGLYGGTDGVTGDSIVTKPGKRPRKATRATSIPLPPGTSVEVRGGGGGGWGSPALRPKAAVERDVALGLLSRSRAEVIFSSGSSTTAAQDA
jgi:N-methylhydantoinase B